MSVKRAKRAAPIEDKITYTPRIANDRLSFALLIESTLPHDWYEFCSFMQAWAHQEIKKMGRRPEDKKQ